MGSWLGRMALRLTAFGQQFNRCCFSYLERLQHTLVMLSSSSSSRGSARRNFPPNFQRTEIGLVADVRLHQVECTSPISFPFMLIYSCLSVALFAWCCQCHFCIWQLKEVFGFVFIYTPHYLQKPFLTGEVI